MIVSLRNTTRWRILMRRKTNWRLILRWNSRRLRILRNRSLWSLITLWWNEWLIVGVIPVKTCSSCITNTMAYLTNNLKTIKSRMPFLVTNLTYLTRLIRLRGWHLLSWRLKTKLRLLLKLISSIELWLWILRLRSKEKPLGFAFLLKIVPLEIVVSSWASLRYKCKWSRNTHLIELEMTFVEVEETVEKIVEDQISHWMHVLHGTMLY